MSILGLWLLSGLIGTVLIAIDIKRNDENIRVKDIFSGLLFILLGVFTLLIAFTTTKMFKGFWDKKLF